MSVRLPGAVQIGPLRYRVITDKVAVAKMQADASNPRCMGHQDSGFQTITIDPSTAPDTQAETLLHEVLHAIWGVTGMSNHPVDKHDEYVITALAPALLDCLRRNPELVKALVRT